MNIQGKNRNVDPYNNSQPIYADTRGRLNVNTGLDGDIYKLFLPPVAVGANKVFFDLFNGTTDKVLEIASVTPIVDGSVAVTGTLAVDLFLTRTTAVGTGGTAATYEGATLTEGTISKFDPASPTLTTALAVTARSAPSGGATAGAILAFDSFFSEETSVATYFRRNLLAIGKDESLARIIVSPSTGIRVVQGAIASVGNVGFDIVFSVVRK